MRSGGELSDPELTCEVPWGTLVRSRGEHFDPESDGEPSDPELAVESVGHTLIMIRSLLWRCGGDHFDTEAAFQALRPRELAVEVRQGSLCSRACCSGPVGNTAI